MPQGKYQLPLLPSYLESSQMRSDQLQNWPESAPFPCGNPSMFLQLSHLHSSHCEGKQNNQAKENEPKIKIINAHINNVHEETAGRVLIIYH